MAKKRRYYCPSSGSYMDKPSESSRYCRSSGSYVDEGKQTQGSRYCRSSGSYVDEGKQTEGSRYCPSSGSYRDEEETNSERHRRQEAERAELRSEMQEWRKKERTPASWGFIPGKDEPDAGPSK